MWVVGTHGTAACRRYPFGATRGLPLCRSRQAECQDLQSRVCECRWAAKQRVEGSLIARHRVCPCVRHGAPIFGHSRARNDQPAHTQDEDLDCAFYLTFHQLYLTFHQQSRSSAIAACNRDAQICKHSEPWIMFDSETLPLQILPRVLAVRRHGDLIPTAFGIISRLICDKV